MRSAAIEGVRFLPLRRQLRFLRSLFQHYDQHLLQSGWVRVRRRVHKRKFMLLARGRRLLPLRPLVLPRNYVVLRQQATRTIVLQLNVHLLQLLGVHGMLQRRRGLLPRYVQQMLWKGRRLLPR